MDSVDVERTFHKSSWSFEEDTSFVIFLTPWVICIGISSQPRRIARWIHGPERESGRKSRRKRLTMWIDQLKREKEMMDYSWYTMSLCTALVALNLLLLFKCTMSRSWMIVREAKIMINSRHCGVDCSENGKQGYCQSSHRMGRVRRYLDNTTAGSQLAEVHKQTQSFYNVKSIYI
jgi:hypothetical protein